MNKDALSSGKVRSRKKLFAILASVLVVAVVAVIIVVVVLSANSTSTYKRLTKAIDNAESMSDFLLEYSTRQTVVYGSTTQDIASIGHILSIDNMDRVYVEINTQSSNSDNPDMDGTATATLYTDGKKVYDITTGTKTEVDMSADEFNDIVNEFGLYRYDPKDVKEEQFTENEKEELKGSGFITVSLNTPGEKVMQAYAQEISVLTGDDVTAEDLTPVAAYVQYYIQDDAVKTQSYTFTVKYTANNGAVLNYTVNSDISYTGDLSEEDYNSFIPIQ